MLLYRPFVKRKYNSIYMLFTDLLLTGSAHAFIQTFCQEEVQQHFHALYMLLYRIIVVFTCCFTKVLYQGIPFHALDL